eukprot:TRINITY_DN12416_c5_g1_i1.p2 TRINITY_DN12416_c5_g1~~TRINITY_DN12416_c5_g1_i1.p2  ORF type:complete len:335 (+),score=61.13 TRINITY_DN12416_c5_g1_i1:2413-3417(+)
MVIGRYQSHKQGGDGGVLLRYSSREEAPVGGIPVIELAEVNCAPLLVQISAKYGCICTCVTWDRFASNFYLIVQVYLKIAICRLVELMEAFYVPEQADGPSIESADEPRSDSPRKSTGQGRRRASSSAIVNDIEEMRLRALEHRTFIYAKVPPIQLCVSYKSEGSIADIHKFVLKLPTYEYHNETCTLVDLMNKYKKEVSGHVLTQAISHKLFGREDVSSAGSERKQAASLDQRKRQLLGKHAVRKDESKKSIKSKIARRFGFRKSRTIDSEDSKPLDSDDDSPSEMLPARSTTSLVADMRQFERPPHTTSTSSLRASPAQERRTRLSLPKRKR